MARDLRQVHSGNITGLLQQRTFASGHSHRLLESWDHAAVEGSSCRTLLPSLSPSIALDQHSNLKVLPLYPVSSLINFLHF